MAAITVTRRRSNVIGNRRQCLLIATIADTNTFTAPFRQVEAISCNDGGVTKVSVSGSTLTFSVTAGPLTGVLLSIVGQ